MKIGLNLLYLIPGEVGGTETYALSLIQALSKLDQENTYYIYLNNESKNIDLPITKNIIPIQCKVNAKNRYFRFLWEQLILPLQALFHRLDILHSLGYIAPICLSCASIVTIHDLNYITIPQAFTPFTRLIQKFFVTLSIKRSSQIVAVSEFTKNEIIKYLPCHEKKITVTLEAPKPRNDNNYQNGDREKNLNKWGIRKPYLLAFSSLAPHKNIDRLIDAFLSATVAFHDTWMLVIIGHLPAEGLKNEHVSKQNGKASNIVATGFISDAYITQLFMSADLFAFPSLYEGFGLPVLEAMQYGVPVASSNRGSLPEVANGAAMFFDPTDVTDIAKVLNELMTDSTQRDKLRSLGYQRVKKFSWETTAENTLDVYQLALSKSRN